MYKLVCFSVISCITKNTAHELAKAQDPYPLTYQQFPLFRKQCSLCLNHRLLSIPIPRSSNELFQYGLLFKHSLVRLSCKSFEMLHLSVSTSLTLSISLNPRYSCFKTCTSIFVFLPSGFYKNYSSGASTSPRLIQFSSLPAASKQYSKSPSQPVEPV